MKSKAVNTKIIIKYNFINNYLKNLVKKNRKIFCIVDKKIKPHLNDIDKINFFYVNGKENLKTYKNYVYLCEKILSNKVDRNSILVGIGGGTVGDICGFIASTILRGIEFNLIPTTLLSQVDSSVGGKNGINSKNGKNLIGTFYHPKEVLIDVNILKSLPVREIRSGYAEIIKHAIIKDKNFFDWLDKNYKKIFQLNRKYLEKAILKSINIKLWYVKQDPHENLINNKSRAMLNFGHSIGHALEALNKYNNSINHGEAISAGMIEEAKISKKLGYLSNDELVKIINHFRKVKLKIYNKNVYNKKIISLLIKDKKNYDNKINFVLIKNIGKSFFERNIHINEIKKNLLKN